MNTQTVRLGVDIGRVIIGGGVVPGSSDTQFFGGDTARMLATPAVPGAFDALSRLVPRFERVWLVSKCGERVQRRSRQWLDHHHFWARTGISRDDVRFCRARPDKAVHCAELGITHFVDDRLDVHRALRGVVAHRYLFGPQTAPPPGWVRPVATWAAAEAAIVHSLPAAVTAVRAPGSP
ncbi:hypothetical protein ACFQFC_07630 [Amorphoplanes digitatis]|uniref:Uncharacterized protein n=1 Tax=Actinoplanes digitatis TaxID=1868 RepID=A0A7W7I0I7_9ACTN|nr:hypothetical protein [Actinoplanes digitatis]MBB4764073.1 hypothetical protein [Actinoplanes digitatis]BFE73412.1 hypothetical protein GCM10020092_067130 [Actinoplanes digitatis]GID97351.1 hypothetical protein Adi01nite_67630 [Actinoplanes digitatis]